MNCRILLTYLIAACMAGKTLRAQSPQFHHINMAEGLSQVSVLAIAQDARGYIWLGTRNGLNRSTAHSFQVYRFKASDSNSLPMNYVTSLLSHKKGMLWVGTTRGLCYFSPEKDRFGRLDQHSEVNRLLLAARIDELYEDSRGWIWVGSNLGLFVCRQPLEMKFEKVERDRSGIGLCGNVISSLGNDSQGNTWVGTENGITIIRFSGQAMSFETLLSSDMPGAIYGKPVTAIGQDRQQRMWVGTANGGLHLFENNTKTFRHFPPGKGDQGIINKNVRKIVPDRQGRLWIGTQEGLSIYDPSTDRFSHYQQEPGNLLSLSQNSIYDIICDNAGNMWIGTYFAGANLVYAVNTSFKSMRYTGGASSINYDVISSFAEDRQHRLWIGTEGGGINLWNRETGQITVYKNQPGNPRSLVSNLVKAVHATRNGNILVGTHSGGLSILNPSSGDFENFQPKKDDPLSLPSADVSAVLEDSRGRIWVGTDTMGVHLFDSQTKTFRSWLVDASRPFKVSAGFVRSFYEDNRGNIWVTTDNGVSMLPPNADHFVSFSTQVKGMAELSPGGYNCVYSDNRNRTWLGTSQSGLVLIEPGKMEAKAFTTANGLAGNTVYGIQGDDDGFLWISTDKGLSRMDMETRLVRNYDVHDGLPGNTFNNSAYFRGTNGELFFGGFTGFTWFDPRSIQQNENTKPVVLTNLWLGNRLVAPGDSTQLLQKDISFTQTLELNHDQNLFSIGFAMLNYIKPEKNQYAWTLEGFEKTWNTGSNHVVTYSNLSPGTYHFRVKGANNDGKWDAAVTSLEIKVHPPLWLSGWAYLLYTLVLGAAVLFVLRFLWLREKFRRETAMQQFKLDFFTNISHEIRTHLSLIIGPVEQLLLKNSLSAAITKPLHHIKSNADRLMRLVSEMMDLRRAETNHLQLRIGSENLELFLQDIFRSCESAAQSKQIAAFFEWRCQTKELFFDRMQMEKVFFNLITNAIKFTPAGGQVKLVTEEDTDEVHISIIDNGVGISPENIGKLFTTYFQVSNGQTEHAGYGIGLALAKSLVTLHKGRLTVDSRQAKPGEPGYTCFRVSLLKGNSYFKGTEHTARISETTLYETVINEAGVSDDFQEEKEFETVLLIEDNTELRAFIRESLEGSYTVLESPNGEEGLQVAFEEVPDIVISDIMMPGMDGLEVCQTLKKDIRTSHIPVILLTARATQDQQVEGLQTGADVYVTKPFSIQVLQLQIANLLASREAMRKRYTQQITLQPRNIAINNADEEFLHQAIDIIEEWMDDEQFGVGMLSHKLAMSQPVLYRKLKALTGMSVNDFIKSIKLKKAAQLLKQKQLTVNEVAFSVGFNDRKYFSREFKKQFGKTPSEYADLENE